MPQPEASEFVRARNQAAYETLPFDDTRDFDDAARGLIAKLEPAVVRNAAGAVVWDNDTYDFLHDADSDEAPDTVHPSLWRQSRLVSQQGLYGGRARHLPGPRSRPVEPDRDRR